MQTSSSESLPRIIQGGMGVGVSGWKLARAVSSTGQLGVISGTAMDAVLARRLQMGDPQGDMRRALDHFPIPGVAERILDRYLIDGGKQADAPFKSKSLPAVSPSQASLELLIAGTFVEVFLAKQGHTHAVGMNLLEKIQAPTLPSLYGAMLAGVDVILIGAGIPRTIPGALDALAQGLPAQLSLDVIGAGRDDHFATTFDPSALWTTSSPPLLKRPRFYAIVSSATLATVLAKKSTGKVDGFIVEGHTAGGHNAPPRGPMQLSSSGEPIYGERDVPDIAAIKALGLPFWLAGSFARPEALAHALDVGAAGVQVGTAFAYCEESGLTPEIKQRVLRASKNGDIKVFTDPHASPTGFPIKLVRLAEDDACSESRGKRMCDLGYLRHAYKRDDGAIGWRCPAEPIADYVRKGGGELDTQHRQCLCNGLLASIGLGQTRAGHDDQGEPITSHEQPIITSGDDAVDIARFLAPGATTYSAASVVAQLLQGASASHAG